MTGEPAIVLAERKMGRNFFANPYWIQVILTGFFLGPIGIGFLTARIIAEANPTLQPVAAQDGWIVAGIIWLLVIGFGLKSFQIANSSKWFELSYSGDEADVDWTSSFRMGKPVDMGEAQPLAVPVSGSQPQYGIMSQRYKTILRPASKTAKGHCWEIPFMDKHLPAILAWLPEEFEKCFMFQGHVVQVFFRAFPFAIENGTRGSFVRTSWTQDPDGTIIPIGLFTHNDLIVKQTRRNLEPSEIPREEVQGLAQTRDNYYRQSLNLQLGLKDREIKNLKEQLEKEKEAAHEYAGGLFLAAKGRHKKEAERLKMGRKTQYGIIIMVIAFLIIGVLGILRILRL